ncbi:MAG: glycosyltransferase [Desulfuromonadales bacterium]|nr:glycosyltransferase [Desulfuromonadales bacterium]
MALISDELTRSCLQHECKIFNVTPLNYKLVLKLWKPDLLFVESAWQGAGNSWEYKIAAFPDRPERSNIMLRKVVAYARDLGIPSVFWNKEDSVHFERFISSASLFDTIFTVDTGCVDLYRQRIDRDIMVNSLMFAVQPKIHNFTGVGKRVSSANFVGSYSRHLHDRRRERQDMLLFAASSTFGLTVYDRNSNRKSVNYRYPDYAGIECKKRVPHHKTADIYKNFLVSLNLNTVDDSETMVSRRLLEILACGGLAVTTPARSVEKHFKDYCYVVDSTAEAEELFFRLRSGYAPQDMAMMEGGAEFILKNHTYAHRLQTILEAIERNRC